MTGMILMYNFDRRTADKIKVLCQKLRLRFREVKPEEYGLPLGALAGLPAAAPEAPATRIFRDPMLVMCALLNPQMNAFLQGLREGGIPPIPLKAVLTPTNVTWDSVHLHDELAQEHEAMQQRLRPEG